MPHSLHTEAQFATQRNGALNWQAGRGRLARRLIPSPRQLEK